MIMLRSPSTGLASRILALSLETNANRFQTRLYSCTSIAARGWIPPEQRSGRRNLPNVRARRPLVNGQTVAFHVNELTALSSEGISNHGIHVDVRHRSNDQMEHQQSNYPNNEYDSDMIVVLDMDECLIHSKFMSNQQDAQLYAHQLRQQNQYDLNSTGAAVETFRVSLNDGTLVHVHVRPGLYDFLQRVCSRYETHIFTAAMDVYANPVLDYIENRLSETNSSNNQAKFAGRWYRQHCTADAGRNAYVKDLNNLWPHIQHQQNRPVDDYKLLSRAVLVDNNPVSFLSNPENGILVSSFYTDSQDTVLPKVLDILQQLEHEPDVRLALAQKIAKNINEDARPSLSENKMYSINSNANQHIPLSQAVA
jgi:Dullard-like phosphatase family protein